MLNELYWKIRALVIRIFKIDEARNYTFVIYIYDGGYNKTVLYAAHPEQLYYYQQLRGEDIKLGLARVGIQKD